MINTTLRQYLSNFYEDITILDNPSFDNSIMGISHNNQLIYEYSSMITEFMTDNGTTMDEAIEFIDYNTIRAIPYMPNPPIIMYNIGECI